MPARAANRSTASTNVRWSVSITNRIASPPAPQPWQKYRLRDDETVNDGVFSSWNGHSPFRLPPPAGLSVTRSEITSTIEVRSRTNPMSSSRILPAMGTGHLRPTSCPVPGPADEPAALVARAASSATHAATEDHREDDQHGGHRHDPEHDPQLLHGPSGEPARWYASASQSSTSSSTSSTLVNFTTFIIRPPDIGNLRATRG